MIQIIQADIDAFIAEIAAQKETIKQLQAQIHAQSFALKAATYTAENAIRHLVVQTEHTLILSKACRALTAIEHLMNGAAYFDRTLPILHNLKLALRIAFPDATTGRLLDKDGPVLYFQLQPSTKHPWSIETSCIVRIETSYDDDALKVCMKAKEIVKDHIINAAQKFSMAYREG